MALLQIEDQSIFYVDRGQGPVLLLLHGAGGNWRQWGHQVRDLAARGRRVIALDLPGHGRSGGEPASRLEAYAPLLCRFMARLDLYGVTLVGHSMGGAIALATALERPPPLARLAVVASGARLRVHRAILSGFASDDGRAIISLIGAWSRAGGTPQKEVDQILASLRATPGKVYLTDFKACARFDVRDRVAALAVPTLILCGKGDTMSPPRNSRELAALLPLSRLEWIEGAGHMVMLERAREVTAALHHFSAPE